VLRPPPRARCAVPRADGDELHEVEGGHQQVLLGVGACAQQVVLAEVSIDEGEQVAFGMLTAELLGDLVGQFDRQPVVDAWTFKRCMHLSCTSSVAAGHTWPLCFIA
jgi:hypothetical protein